jgi:hypothetical protein
MLINGSTPLLLLHSIIATYNGMKERWKTAEKNNLRRNKDSRMGQSHPSSDFSPKNTPLLFEKKYNAFSSLVLSWGAGLLLRKAYPNALYA